MEWTNDFGLRDADAESDGGEPSRKPQAQDHAALDMDETVAEISLPTTPGVDVDRAPGTPGRVRCRCAEQQGRCIYCRLGQLRAENEHMTEVHYTSDPRVVYAEAAARQLEAQFFRLGGRINAEDPVPRESEQSSDAASSPRIQPRKSGYMDDDGGGGDGNGDGDGASLPDWLVKMIHDPPEESRYRSASPYQHRHSRGRSRETGDGTRRSTDNATPNHQRSDKNMDRGGRGPAAARNVPTGRLSPRVVAPSREQRRDRRLQPQKQRSAVQRGPQELYNGAPGRQVSVEQKRARKDAKSRCSDASMSPPPRHQSPRRSPSARGLSRVDESSGGAKSANSTTRKPRPWSSQPAGCGPHFSSKQTDTTQSDRERRRQADLMALSPPDRRRGPAMKQHAKSTTGSGRDSSDTNHRRQRGADGTAAISHPTEEVSRLRRENEALHAELNDQKKLFRKQLSRLREEKNILKEQIVLLHAEKQAGAWPAK